MSYSIASPYENESAYTDFINFHAKDIFNKEIKKKIKRCTFNSTMRNVQLIQ